MFRSRGVVFTNWRSKGTLIALVVDRFWEYQIRLLPSSYAGAAISLSRIIVSLLGSKRFTQSGK
jgi:hypothetical protein